MLLPVNLNWNEVRDLWDSSLPFSPLMFLDPAQGQAQSCFLVLRLEWPRGSVVLRSLCSLA